MLQIKNLVKIYKPKKGVPVTALADVSLTLPEKGMVFLLGKSGSGKSTLLNILGGLDRYNAGDILVMGKSTRKWGQSHFDSYRNTYVGFIFQEYNILNEFSVGANIALALQLQGHKPTNERINAILRAVDLDGYGNRNPNELSGGQKQRVAIARALVKSPKIIMADEPTGALDSNTGRQVLTTLKNLSRDKLVIVVSHDREFAEQYADRIIELADGHVIRDVERLAADNLTDSAVPVYMEDSVSLPEQYILTQADKEAICQYIQNMVNVGQQPRFSLFSKRSTAFQPTDESRIPVSQAGYKLIKSRLPLKYAFKLGASGLKHKKFRLVMTILLSCIALGFFGLADTLTSYDYVTTAHRSLTDEENNITYAAFEKHVEDEDNYYYGTTHMSQEDLERIEEETGLDLYPVYSASGISMYETIPEESYYSASGYYMTEFAGCIEISDKLLHDMDARLVAGSMPENSSQVVISTHILETFQEYGYRAYDPQTGTSQNYEINSPEDILGKTISSGSQRLTICGLVDTGLDLDRYESLKDVNYEELASFADMIAVMALESELDYARRYSLDGLLMVSGDFIDTYGNAGMVSTLSQCTKLGHNGTSMDYYVEMALPSSWELLSVTWLDGQTRTALAEDEIVMSRHQYYDIMSSLYADPYTGNIPEEYDFDQMRSLHKGFGSMAELTFTLNVQYDPYTYYYEYDISDLAGSHPVKLVGILDDDTYRCFLSNDLLAQADAGTILQTLSPMPEDSRDILKLVEFSDEDFDSRENVTEVYNLMNPVTFELKNLDQIFLVLKTVFFWIGMVFVIFASLLFSNFIATSVSYKKEQIGILRAIGSRGADVFRIFFAESFIIAMINFALSFGGTIAVCAVINTLLKSSTGLLLTVLNVGVRQMLLILGVCLLSAFVACYLPVRKIAAKRPIDAIRDR